MSVTHKLCVTNKRLIMLIACLLLWHSHTVISCAIRFF
ncbi:hypothetical protein HMPREF0424_1265 [Gardnerella vaginalis 409-05]|nr:hypothetical protein HMPREF0424_1265 [Gardnerella vaginalis 409-05]